MSYYCAMLTNAEWAISMGLKPAKGGHLVVICKKNQGLQYFLFMQLYTSTSLHLRGKYCTFYSATFVSQHYSLVTFQLTLFS